MIFIKKSNYKTGLKVGLIFLLLILGNLTSAQQVQLEERTWTEWKKEIIINDSLTGTKYYRDTLELSEFLHSTSITLVKDSMKYINDSIKADLFCLYFKNHRLGCFISSLQIDDIKKFNEHNKVIRYENNNKTECTSYFFYTTVLEDLKNEVLFDSTNYLTIKFKKGN